MSKSIFITSVLLLAVTVHTTPQLIDFFQGFNSFLQPYQHQSTATKKPATNRHTNKPSRRYEDVIFFSPDEILREKTKATTSKPRKSSTKNTQTTKSRTDVTNLNSKVISFDNSGYNRKIDNGKVDNHNANNGRIDNHNANNGKVDNHNANNGRVNNHNANNGRINYSSLNSRRTTQRQRTYESYDRTTPSYYHSYTTINPLLNRPGVKPAVVDENRPPITNKPVTDAFYDRPEFHRPDKTTNRPTSRPSSRPTSRPTSRPVTSRPSYERPVTSAPSYERPSRPGYEKPIWPNDQGRPGEGSEDAEEPEIEIGPDEDEMSAVQKKRFIEIAEQKCEEYKSMKKKKIVALPLAPDSHGVELNVSTCPKTNVPLIIGGKVVTINEFPHMGLVGWKKIQTAGYSWKCGSSLISDQFLLTAGHCTYHDKDYNVVSGPPHAVQLGSSYLDDSSATVVKISSIIRHPKYKLRRSYHDIALIKLTVGVTFSEVISPACLGVPPAVGEPIIATGWGKTEFGGDSSLELRSVSIPIWDMDECREIWGTSRKLPQGPSPDNQLCAGERSGGKDTCQGDSGGPAQVQDGCLWRVVAITSVGRSCGAPDTPALYAKLPRAFISSQAFKNVKYNENNNNDRYNGNNDNANNGYNGNNGNANNGYNANNGNANNGYNTNNGNANTYNTNNANVGYNVNTGTANGYNANNDQKPYNVNTNTGYNANNNENNSNNDRYNGYNVNSNTANVNTGYSTNNGFSVNNDRDNRYNNNNGYTGNVNTGSNIEYNVNNNRNNGNTDNRYINNANVYTVNNNGNPNNGYNANNANNGYTDNLYNQNYNNRDNIYNANRNKKIVAISRPLTTTQRIVNRNENKYNGYINNDNGYNRDNVNYDNVFGYNQYTTEGYVNEAFPLVANRPWWNR